MRTIASVTIDDALIRQSVDAIVKNQLAEIVDKKLGSFVEGHLAKHKLQGRAPKAISERIDAMVNAAVTRAIRDYKLAVEDRIDVAIRNAIRKHIEAAITEPKIKENVMKFLQEKLKVSMKL